MSGNNDLKTVSPHLLCQFYTDLMAQFRGNFTGPETLVAVPGDILILLSVPLFGQNYLPQGRFPKTVDGGDIGAVCGFARVLDVREHIEKVLCSLWDGFLRVFH